jgi:hypothetical protein
LTRAICGSWRATVVTAEYPRGLMAHDQEKFIPEGSWQAGALISSGELYDMVCRAAEGFWTVPASRRRSLCVLTVPLQGCGMAEKKGSSRPEAGGGCRWLTRAAIRWRCGRK